MNRPFSERQDQAFSRLPSLALLASLMLVPVLAGCPGTLDPRFLNGGGAGGMIVMGGTGGAGVAGPPCDAPIMYFQATDATGCALAGACHDASGAAALSKLNLADAGVWSRLSNVPAASPTGTKCLGMPLVNPTRPAGGVLITRVSVVDGCGPGTLMPFGAQAVNQPIAACITSWVNSQLP